MTLTTCAPGTSVAGRAVRDAAPVILAYVPFGLAVGATLAATHVPSLIAYTEDLRLAR